MRRAPPGTRELPVACIEGYACVGAALEVKGRFLNLREVCKMLRNAEDPKGVLQALAALKALLPAQPDELQQHAGAPSLQACPAPHRQRSSSLFAGVCPPSSMPLRRSLLECRGGSGCRCCPGLLAARRAVADAPVSLVCAAVAVLAGPRGQPGRGRQAAVAVAALAFRPRGGCCTRREAGCRRAGKGAAAGAPARVGPRGGHLRGTGA